MIGQQRAGTAHEVRVPPDADYENVCSRASLGRSVHNRCVRHEPSTDGAPYLGGPSVVTRFVDGDRDSYLTNFDSSRTYAT
jgi:hypothetical protein